MKRRNHADRIAELERDRMCKAGIDAHGRPLHFSQLVIEYDNGPDQPTTPGFVVNIPSSAPDSARDAGDK